MVIPISAIGLLKLQDIFSSSPLALVMILQGYELHEPAKERIPFFGRVMVCLKSSDLVQNAPGAGAGGVSNGRLNPKCLPWHRPPGQACASRAGRVYPNRNDAVKSI